MICANKKMISLTDVQKISISDLNRSGTIVSEMVKCGANLVLEWKVDFSQKFVHHPKQEIWSQNVHVLSRCRGVLSTRTVQAQFELTAWHCMHMQGRSRRVEPACGLMIKSAAGEEVIKETLYY